jgi:CTP:molybdopterin cytidylyltransferase MocA
VDVVGVEDEVMRTIVEAGVKNRATIIPTFQGKGGHPVFLCPEAIKEILKQDPKTGRLDTILKMRSDTRRIEVASGSILNNVNTPDEWEKHENNLWHGS